MKKFVLPVALFLFTGLIMSCASTPKNKPNSTVLGFFAIRIVNESENIDQLFTDKLELTIKNLNTGATCTGFAHDVNTSLTNFEGLFYVQNLEAGVPYRITKIKTAGNKTVGEVSLDLDHGYFIPQENTEVNLGAILFTIDLGNNSCHIKNIGVKFKLTHDGQKSEFQDIYGLIETSVEASNFEKLEIPSIRKSYELAEIPGKNIRFSRTEVTTELYNSVVGDGNETDASAQDYPVDYVSWFDAIYFCNKLSEEKNLEPVYAVNGSTNYLDWGYTPNEGGSIEGEITQNISANGYRLPTADEWKYAAKGNDDFIYSGSDELDAVGWFYENCKAVQPVAQKQRNDFSLYDMSGNVREWVWDINGNGRCAYGGNYSDKADGCMITRSCSLKPSYKTKGLGFRIVHTIMGEEPVNN